MRVTRVREIQSVLPKNSKMTVRVSAAPPCFSYLVTCCIYNGPNTIGNAYTWMRLGKHILYENSKRQHTLDRLPFSHALTFMEYVNTSVKDYSPFTEITFFVWRLLWLAIINKRNWLFEKIFFCLNFEFFAKNLLIYDFSRESIENLLNGACLNLFFQIPEYPNTEPKETCPWVG